MDEKNKSFDKIGRKVFLRILLRNCDGNGLAFQVFVDALRSELTTDS
jgi:hypothetical protein